MQPPQSPPLLHLQQAPAKLMEQPQQDGTTPLHEQLRSSQGT
jgi:hypothetical protein